MTRVRPRGSDRQHKVAAIAHAATHSIVQAVCQGATEARPTGWPRGRSQSPQDRLPDGPQSETQSAITGSGEAPMNDEMETLQRIPIKGNS